MQLFLDSAVVAQVAEIAGWGVLDGVTTNPTLIARSGQDLTQVVQQICALVDGPVSAECLETDTDGMVDEGQRLAAIHPNVVVKVPLTVPGLAAVAKLSKMGIRTNVTLCFSLAQGMLAARAGATYVSPFMGRLDDLGQEGLHLVGDLVATFARHNIRTKVLAASVRHPLHVTEAAQRGAHAATIPYNVFVQLVRHPLTDAGVAQFLRDAGRA